jgi:hypothetical protein
MPRSRRWGLLLLLVLVSRPVAGVEPDWVDGRPEFKEGVDRGYFIWREGKQWHVRWTTRGSARFSGSVTSQGGELKSLKPIDVDEIVQQTDEGRESRVVVGRRGGIRVKPGTNPGRVKREQDRIRKDGEQRIHWTSRNDADLDGFDFKLDDEVESLRFVLEIDGATDALSVTVGGRNRHPDRNPFSVELR